MNLGRQIYITEPIDIAEKFQKIAQQDELSAKTLEAHNLFNQAGYFYIQSMEKLIKSHIAKKVNVLQDYFAKELYSTMGHSLDESSELLVKIYSKNDDVLFQQIRQQLKHQVFQNVNFSVLHNKVRYPAFNGKHHNYVALELTKKDCQGLRSMLDKLKKYLADLN